MRSIALVVPLLLAAALAPPTALAACPGESAITHVANGTTYYLVVKAVDVALYHESNGLPGLQRSLCEGTPSDFKHVDV